MITLADEIACIERQVAIQRRIGAGMSEPNFSKVLAERECLEAVLVRLLAIQAFEEATRDER